MRSILSSALGLLALACANAETVELNERNILYAVMGQIDDFDHTANAEAALAMNRMVWSGWSEDQRKAEVEAYAAATRARSAELDEDTVWRASGFVSVVNYEPTTGKLQLAPLIGEIHPLNIRGPRDRKQLGRSYSVIVVNHEALRVQMVPEARRPGVSEAFKRNRRAYVDVDMNFGEFTMNTAFQAPVRKISIRASANAEEPLFEWTNPKSNRESIRASLVREGMSLDVTPVHHLELDGGRLLDPLETDVPGRSCEETGRVQSHLVVVCNMKIMMVGVQSTVRQTFIGGQLVQSAYRALTPPEPPTMARLERFLVEKLDRPADQTRWSSEDRWQARFDPARMTAADTADGPPYLVVAATVPKLQIDLLAAALDGMTPVGDR